MEEEKSILDTIYKTCTCCGLSRTLRNYRMIGKSEVNDGLTLIADMFSNVCKCCEARPEFKSKENRLANLREKMARFKQNEMKRLDKVKHDEMLDDFRSMGRVNYLHPDKN